MSTVTGPSVWHAIRSDPTTPFDSVTLAMVVRDQQRPSRRWVYPWLRYASRFLVALIRLAKTLVPVPVSAHSTMDHLCIWFLRRFVSVEACALLMRHFVVETNLLNVIAAHSGGAVEPVALRPRTIADLGNRAVLVHDINVYDVLTRLRLADLSGPVRLDPALLEVPALDPEPGRRRWLNLDIQSALCLMNIPFAACLTPSEYERAVHSMRLDDSLLALLANLTGDATFLRWCRGGVTVRVDSAIDVPRAVYEHAVICEHAHERLLQLARRRRVPPSRPANEPVERVRLGAGQVDGEEGGDAVGRAWRRTGSDRSGTDQARAVRGSGQHVRGIVGVDLIQGVSYQQGCDRG